MLNLLQKKTIRVLSSLAVSLGAVLVPANIVQAAVFKLTIDGLGGSGEIGFDDESLYGLSKESVYGSQLRNGYFNWSFGGTATIYASSYDYYNDYETNFSYSVPVSLASSNDGSQTFSAFKNAKFIFEQGKLVGINNYSWSTTIGGGPSYTSRESLELNNNRGTVSYNLTSFGQGTGVYYYSTGNLNQSGSQKFSTIKSWEGVPKEGVPEPNTIAASLMGIGFLIKKKIAFRPKNSQKSEKI